MRNPKTHKRVKAHTRYELKDGTYVPGVTTVINLLNKPALVKWANNLGLEGVDSGKFTDELAEIGSVAHSWIESDLKRKSPSCLADDYTGNQLEAAQPCIEKYKRWHNTNKVNPILVEKPLISENHRFGGTSDLYCELNGVKTLLDWKTGSGLYEAHKIQLAANKILLIENGYEVEECRLLSIGRNPREDTIEIVVGGITERAKIFLRLLEIYRILKHELKTRI